MTPIKRREFLKGASLLAAGPALAVAGYGATPERDRPNIVWILAEDMCPDLSCYGTKGVSTPNLDQMAAEGARYTNAFCTAPVCSPSRSAMMTGMHQNAIGANQHRTSPKRPLPDGIKPITHYLREAGYYTALGCGYSRKTDLNFLVENLFDGNDWKDRKAGQPFFAQITLNNTHRAWGRDKERPIDIKDVEIPPYYPDTPFVRRDWANGLEEIQIMDRHVGKILQRLKDEGIEHNTVVIFIGDNGRCHIRGKQFLYDPGLHVPLIIRWPARTRPGAVSDELVSTIDLSAGILSLAGVPIPEHLHGRNLSDPATPRREYVYAARDKMDDTHDSMRAVRSKRYKYILNLMPERAWCQFNRYKESQYPMLALMNVLNMEGKLTPEQARFMAPRKPEEELYDLRTDPHELKNLASDPAHRAALDTMRAELAAWRKKIGDQGVSEAFRKGGWPSKYPTRTLDEWKTLAKAWEEHLLEGKPRPPALKREPRPGQRQRRKKQK